MSMFDYIMISGHGRSGTNWLLEVLNLSSHTYCRNEPNELNGSLLNGLGSEWIIENNGAALNETWDRAISKTEVSVGVRDQKIDRDKEFLRAFPKSIGIYRMINSSRLRRLISKLIPAVRCHEWLAPALVFRRNQMHEALTIIKVNQAPGWACWLLENRRRAAVLHIVRHPGGMLNSWKKRYLNKNVREKVEADNRDRLNKIARLTPVWRERFGDIDNMSVEESELWFWCYSTETVHTAGQFNERYRLILFDDLARNPDEGVRGVYEFCGLDYTPDIRDQVMALSENSEAIASSWKKTLSEKDREKIARICSGSPMTAWWPDIV